LRQSAGGESLRDTPPCAIKALAAQTLTAAVVKIV